MDQIRAAMTEAQHIGRQASIADQVVKRVNRVNTLLTVQPIHLDIGPHFLYCPGIGQQKINYPAVFPNIELDWHCSRPHAAKFIQVITNARLYRMVRAMTAFWTCKRFSASS